MIYVFFIGSVTLLLVTCAELWSMGKKIEDLTDRVKSMQHWMKSKDTHEKELLDELREREDECYELRQRLGEL